MEDDLIYNQTKIPKKQWRYGLRSSAATGCGWIATYNALRLMNYRAQPKDLIRYYERQFPIVHGNAEEDANQLLAAFRQHLDVVSGFVSPVSPALAIHTGPGLLGAIVQYAD